MIQIKCSTIKKSVKTWSEQIRKSYKTKLSKKINQLIKQLLEYSRNKMQFQKGIKRLELQEDQKRKSQQFQPLTISQREIAIETRIKQIKNQLNQLKIDILLKESEQLKEKIEKEQLESIKDRPQLIEDQFQLIKDQLESIRNSIKELEINIYQEGESVPSPQIQLLISQDLPQQEEGLGIQRQGVETQYLSITQYSSQEDRRESAKDHTEELEINIYQEGESVPSPQIQLLISQDLPQQEEGLGIQRQGVETQYLSITQYSSQEDRRESAKDHTEELEINIYQEGESVPAQQTLPPISQDLYRQQQELEILSPISQDPHRQQCQYIKQLEKILKNGIAIIIICIIGLITIRAAKKIVPKKNKNIIFIP